ncbi:MAG TPA: hypothetical protein DCZ94_03295 [Lentisphaeria bacterium]|nr:MAG: hypothetical protein A2X48_03960 [Lentisphaerae bacterium GWF2_49_21]HBC85960.1 hypothetical protein [Lentisphaeria bacterium]
MKSSITTFLVATLVLVFWSSSLHAQVAGGYTKAETDDLEIANSANFAMKAQEAILRKDNKDAKVSLVKILEASKQVVAGMNYKMKLKVNVDDKEKIAEVVVWKKLSGEYELTSWNYKKEEKK